MTVTEERLWEVYHEALADVYASRRIRWSSLTGWARWVLLGLAVLNVAAALLVANAAAGCAVGVVCAPL